MAGNKPGVKLQRNKARSTASVSPARSQLSDDASNAAPDLSVLRKSIGTSITGFPQARNVFDAGTHEIKQLLSNECDIIYECRVCRNLFRSLANFISHKRIYCCETFKTSIHPHFNNNNFMNDDIIAIIQHEEEYLNFVKNKKKANYKNGISVEYGKKNHPKDLTSIVEKLKCRENSKLIPDSTDPKYPNKIYAKLQSISGTKNAVYQNIFCDNAVPSDLMKDQIAELDRLISLNEAVLGPDGKLISQNVSSSNDALDEKLDSNSQDDLFCNICKISFSTQKTLKFHMKHKHAENRLVYPCLDCTDTFSNPWSVYRHLLKVHRKSATHIRKLRESIQNKAFKLDSYSIENMKSVEVPVDSITEQQRVNQENQAWIDNLERDGDIPRCGGCGKKFERRAALSSHRQTCQLRKSAQNKLNSNQRKIGVKSAIKDVDDSVLLEPFVKISRIDKPIEKRIEIKIRKDYNKSSPINIRTSSPADEDSTTESMEHSETPNVGFVLEREREGCGDDTSKRSDSDESKRRNISSESERRNTTNESARRTKTDRKEGRNETDEFEGRNVSNSERRDKIGTAEKNEKAEELDTPCITPTTLSGSATHNIIKSICAWESNDETKTKRDDSEVHPTIYTNSISNTTDTDRNSKIDRIIHSDPSIANIPPWSFEEEDSASSENESVKISPIHTFEDIKEIIFGRNSTENWTFCINTSDSKTANTKESSSHIPSFEEEKNGTSSDIANNKNDQFIKS